jgi:hypothetical protein
MKGLFYYILIVALMSGCFPDKVATEQELIEFVRDPDHGLNKSEEINGTRVTVIYKPTDLLVAQEIRNKPVDANKLAAVKEKYSAYNYFTVSFSQNNKEALHTQNGMDAYSDLVQTLAFKMSDYVTLTTNSSDTIPVADFILNRTFGMSKSTDLLFVFSKEKSAGKEWVQFNLNEFGLNTGNQRFRFLKKDLDRVPSLLFETTPTHL